MFHFLPKSLFSQASDELHQWVSWMNMLLSGDKPQLKLILHFFVSKTSVLPWAENRFCQPRCSDWVCKPRILDEQAYAVEVAFLKPMPVLVLVSSSPAESTQRSDFPEQFYGRNGNAFIAIISSVTELFWRLQHLLFSDFSYVYSSVENSSLLTKTSWRDPWARLTAPLLENGTVKKLYPVLTAVENENLVPKM